MDPRMRTIWIAMMALLAAAPALAAPAVTASPAKPKPAASTTAKAPAGDAGLPDAIAVMQKTERVMESLAKRVTPAVVNIRRFVKDEAWWDHLKHNDPGSPGWQLVSAADQLHPEHRPLTGGSGFIVSADGYIMTLRRVVVDPQTSEPAPFVEVEAQSKYYTAQVVSLEPTLDLAILKITAPDPLPFLKFGDSSKAVAGHWAIAFGDPDGHERTLMPGFVAVSPSRECYQDDMSATYMQVSMTVPDGALGGPVVNTRGEVIGLNARLAVSGASGPAPQERSGLAVPSNIVSAIFQALLISQSRESPWIGVSVLALNDTLRAKLGPIKGIVIDNVFAPSPASRAGVQVNDILSSMDGQPIVSVYDFQRVLYDRGAGSRVRLGLVRAKKPLEVQVTIDRRPPEATTH